jgi:hypothetical protein
MARVAKEGDQLGEDVRHHAGAADGWGTGSAERFAT